MDEIECFLHFGQLNIDIIKPITCSFKGIIYYKIDNEKVIKYQDKYFCSCNKNICWHKYVCKKYFSIY